MGSTGGPSQVVTCISWSPESHGASLPDMGVMFLGRAVTGGTVNGDPIPEVPDLARMRRQRSSRLRASMRERRVDALLLLGTSAVQYASGAPAPIVDASRATLLRPV